MRCTDPVLALGKISHAHKCLEDAKCWDLEAVRHIERAKASLIKAAETFELDPIHRRTRGTRALKEIRRGKIPNAFGGKL